jgi:hypothetical protein
MSGWLFLHNWFTDIVALKIVQVQARVSREGCGGDQAKKQLRRSARDDNPRFFGAS